MYFLKCDNRSDLVLHISSNILCVDLVFQSGKMPIP